MASTNKTQAFQLSQFVGTDVPSWLGDYNADMSKIDAGLSALGDTAYEAQSKASQVERDYTALSLSIAETLNGFNVQKHNVTQNTNMSGDGSYVALYSTVNKKIVQVTVYGYLPATQTSATGLIQDSPVYYLPVFSCNDNCLGLPVGNILENDYVYRVGVANVRFSRAKFNANSELPAYSVSWLVAIWDGSKTEYYLRFESPAVIFGSNNTFNCEITSLNAGTYDA